MTDNAKKWIWVSVGAVTLGTGGFFLFKAIKNKFNQTRGNNNSSDGTNTGDNRSYSPRNNRGSTANPFKTKAEVLAFQQWVINTKGDKTILGGGGASGFGDDGAWGTNTAAAWAKYGSDYKSSSQGMTTSANTWSSNDAAATQELTDRLDYDANQDTDETSWSDGKEDIYWYPAGRDSSTGYTRVRFSEGGAMVLEKRKANSWGNVESYTTKNGTWKKTATGWEFSLDGKNYPSAYGGNDIINILWGMLKASGFHSPDGSFVPFSHDKSKNSDWQSPLL